MSICTPPSTWLRSSERVRNHVNSCDEAFLHDMAQLFRLIPNSPTELVMSKSFLFFQPPYPYLTRQRRGVGYTQVDQSPDKPHVTEVRTRLRTINHPRPFHAQSLNLEEYLRS